MLQQLPARWDAPRLWKTDAAMTAQILSYSRAKGVFAGISLTGSTVRSDGDANNLYGKDRTATEIVRGDTVKVTPAGQPLLDVSNAVAQS